jgi:RnfABCDGE-type electron transport complex B subunit
VNNIIIISTIALGALGLISAVILYFVANKFKVYEDPKIDEVEEALPSANCGGCGFPGCNAAADSVVAGKSPANVCVVGGPESAEEVAGIMGIPMEYREI